MAWNGLAVSQLQRSRIIIPATTMRAKKAAVGPLFSVVMVPSLCPLCPGGSEPSLTGRVI